MQANEKRALPLSYTKFQPVHQLINKLLLQEALDTLQVWASSNDSAVRIQAMNYMVYINNRNRNYEESGKVIDRVKQEVELNLDTTNFYTAVSWLYEAQLLSFINKPKEALPLAWKASTLLQEFKPSIELTRSIVLLADIYNFQFSNLDQGENLYRKAMELLEEDVQPQYYDTLLVWYGLSSCLGKKGDYERAVLYAEMGLQEIAKRPIAEQILYSAFLQSVGINYYRHKKYKEATRYFLEAIDSSKSKSQSSLFYLNLANCYLQQDQLEKASTLLYRLGARKRKNEDVQQLVNYNLTKVEFFKKSNEEDSCFYYVKQSLAEALQLHGSKNISTAFAYQSAASAYLHFNQPDSAVQFAHRAIIASVSNFEDTNILSNPKLKTEDIKYGILTFFSDKAEALYQVYVARADMLALQQSLKLANTVDSMSVTHLRKNFTQLAAMEISKALQPHKSTGIPSAFLLYQQTGDTTYARQALTLMDASKASVMYRDLAEVNNLKSLLDQGTGVEEIEMLSDSINYLEGERQRGTSYMSLLKRREASVRAMEETNPNFYKARFSQPKINPKTLDNLLNHKNACIISYFATADRLYCLGYSPGTWRFVEIPKQEYDELKNSFFEELNKPIVESSTNRFAEVSYNLFKKIVEPVLPLKKVDHLLFAADAATSSIPFESLVCTPAKDIDTFASLDYLIKQYTVSSQFSIGMLLEDTEPFHFENAVVVTDKNLFGSEKEFTLIAARIKAVNISINTTPKKDLPKAVRHADILHFSIHGSLDATKNYEPRFTLGKDTSLYAHEFYTWPISASLTVLSSCESQAGDYRAGEGVQSMARAFRYAGSSGLVAALWQIPDVVTAELIGNFYKNINSQTDIAQALQQSKLLFLTEADSYKAHPKNWSGLIYIGSVQDIKIDNWFKNYRLILFISALLTTLLLLRKKIASRYLHKS